VSHLFKELVELRDLDALPAVHKLEAHGEEVGVRL
jgi:hypothetical protein